MFGSDQFDVSYGVMPEFRVDASDKLFFSQEKLLSPGWVAYPDNKESVANAFHFSHRCDVGTDNFRPNGEHIIFPDPLFDSKVFDEISQCIPEGS